MSAATGPIGVVLAGGGGRRIGGDKAGAVLAGRPLISYPLSALASALGTVAVVAKSGTKLPPLPQDVEVWVEPDLPQHPIVGIVEALRRAAGRAIVIAACDMPLLDAGTIATIASADGHAAPAVVAAAVPGGALQPLLGRYEPAALTALEVGSHGSNAPLRELVTALRPRLLDVPAGTLFNVNSAEDLAQAEAALARRYPKVKS